MLRDFGAAKKKPTKKKVNFEFMKEKKSKTTAVFKTYTYHSTIDVFGSNGNNNHLLVTLTMHVKLLMPMNVSILLLNVLLIPLSYVLSIHQTIVSIMLLLI